MVNWLWAECGLHSLETGNGVEQNKHRLSSHDSTIFTGDSRHSTLPVPHNSCEKSAPRWTPTVPVVYQQSPLPSPALRLAVPRKTMPETEDATMKSLKQRIELQIPIRKVMNANITSCRYFCWFCSGCWIDKRSASCTEDRFGGNGRQITIGHRRDTMRCFRFFILIVFGIWHSGEWNTSEARKSIPVLGDESWWPKSFLHKSNKMQIRIEFLKLHFQGSI